MREKWILPLWPFSSPSLINCEMHCTLNNPSVSNHASSLKINGQLDFSDPKAVQWVESVTAVSRLTMRQAAHKVTVEARFRFTN